MRYAQGMALHRESINKHGAGGNSPDHPQGEIGWKSDMMSDQLRTDEAKYIGGPGCQMIWVTCNAADAT